MEIELLEMAESQCDTVVGTASYNILRESELFREPIKHIWNGFSKYRFLDF